MEPIVTTNTGRMESRLPSYSRNVVGVVGGGWWPAGLWTSILWEDFTLPVTARPADSYEDFCRNPGPVSATI